MSINAEIQTRCDLSIAAIHETTNIPPITKSTLTQALLASAKCTNGYTPEQKTQAMSESMFGLVELMTIHYISDSEFKEELKQVITDSVAKIPQPQPKPQPTKLALILDTIRDCKRQLMWLGIAIVTLLAYRPDIASVIKDIVNCDNFRSAQVQTVQKSEIKL